jgi:hypothetical protein
MAEEIELNSFIYKFKKLWKSGFTTHLDGKAWVGLRLHLGDAPGPVHHHDLAEKCWNSPAKERHRDRRANLRENKENEKQESELLGEAVEETPVGNDGNETAGEADNHVEENDQEDSEKEDTADNVVQ